MTQTLEPKSVEDVSEIVRSTGSAAIATIGSGTQLGLGNPATREGLSLRMRGLNRIVDYVPEDQVVVVDAGIALDELQAELSKHRQRLAIDSLAGDGATIGGMLSTNAYGASAMRYGTLKDLIVGIELVRADGVIARAGGKVVKNVAGFDVSKLMVGSLGTLAIITKATFRVHPLPEVTRRLSFGAKIDRVFPFVLALREAQLEPVSLATRINGEDAAVDVIFEGFGPGVAAQSTACENVAKSAGMRAGDESTARNVIPSVVDRQGQFRLKATFPPAKFATIARAIKGEALMFPSLGVGFLAPFDYVRSAHDAQDDIRVDHATMHDAKADHATMHYVAKLRALIESLGGTLVVHDMPDEWRGQIDAWGTPPPSFKLMRALKDRFDPEYRLNPGRFVGGL